MKPPEMTPQAAAKELEEVMKRVREAQSFISAAIEPGRYIVLITEQAHSVFTLVHISNSIFRHKRRVSRGIQYLLGKKQNN